jgi:hypothetical protein
VAATLDPRARLRGYVIGLGVVVAAALPVARDATDDSFPLSTYPMFAREIEKPTVYFVERLEAKGRASRLTPEQVSGNEVMQSFKNIRAAVRTGPEAVTKLCRGIAERLARRERRKRSVELRVVGARFDPVAYFTEDAAPEERTIEGTCKVPAR